MIIFRRRCDEGDNKVMTKEKSNIVLIGMPGSGKSTIGVILAKMTTRDFVDTDVVIQTSQGRSLQDIVDTEGHQGLRRIEEDILRDLRCSYHVIATGGSAVYSDSAMKNLKSGGVIVFLDVDLVTLTSRVKNFDTRGLVRRPDQSLEDLFRERYDLYRKYAEITIECANLGQEEVCATIIAAMR